VIDTPRDSGVEEIVVGLTRDITRLRLGKALTVAEFTTPGLTVWKVRPDACGVPRIRYWRHEWASLRDWDLLNDGVLLERIVPEDATRIVLFRSGPRLPLGAGEAAERNARDADRAFELAQAKYPNASALTTVNSVKDLLGEATARVPLPPSLWYELVELRRRRSGRLELTVQQLFLPGARRGDTRQFTIRCAASGPRGTAFAVVARDEALNFELVSLAYARIPPGSYDVTATLLRPGLVQFDGLPATLRPDSRSWLDIRAALPDSLDEIKSAHLIVAVERFGAADVLQERLHRAAQLFDHVSAAAGPVTYSLVTYASHSHPRVMRDEQNRVIRDEPVTVHAWQQRDTGLVEQALRVLRDRDPAPAWYPRAAQVECMLAEVADWLGVQDGAAARRLVLVTIGNKRAFPSRVDPATGIIPCPRHNNWSAILKRLVDDHGDVAFGAIRDRDADIVASAGLSFEIWRRLGANGIASLDHFDARAFAVGLGLLSPATQHLPLPLAVPEGAG